MAAWNRSGATGRLFQALADPTRRAVLERLSRGPASVSDLARPFDMCIAASFMRHIHVLEASGWIRTRKVDASAFASSTRNRLLRSKRGFPATRPLGRAHRSARAVCSHRLPGGHSRMFQPPNPDTRFDAVARHQGPSAGRMERLDGPRQLRAVVGSRAGRARSWRWSSVRAVVRDLISEDGGWLRAAPERLLPRRRRRSNGYVSPMPCSAGGDPPRTPS